LRISVRKIIKPWTDDEISRLRKLQASGATVARASIALKRSKSYIREKARELGTPFATLRERKKLQASREAAERVAAGLSPKQPE
jgi:orotate phosphoribosyltransferase